MEEGSAIHLFLWPEAAERSEIETRIRRAGYRVQWLAHESELVQTLEQIAFLLLGRPPRIDWSRAHRLELIQLSGTGADPLLPAPGLGESIQIANARGLHADAVRDHALAMILAFARDLPNLLERQRRAEWHRVASESVTGKLVVLVGLGSVGSRIAAACGALGMRVSAVTRSAVSVAGVASVYGPERLREAIAAADYVVICLPLTTKTRGLVDASIIGALPAHAVLVNVSRGGIVDEPSLERALHEGRLRGAALDVFADEPLAQTSSLWSCPGLIISPHVAGFTRHYFEPIVEILLENVKRVRAGLPVTNPVSRELEY